MRVKREIPFVASKHATFSDCCVGAWHIWKGNAFTLLERTHTITMESTNSFHREKKSESVREVSVVSLFEGCFESVWLAISVRQYMCNA